MVHHGAHRDSQLRTQTTSQIGQQRWHQPAAVMGNPGLLQELPDITPLLAQDCGDGEQAPRPWLESDCYCNERHGPAVCDHHLHDRGLRDP
jgi:hypothetical protein